MARRPVDQPYRITTEFGVPDSNAKFGRHSGVDYAVPTGRPIYAPATGTLTNVVSATGGNMVVIQAGGLYHRLMHNSSFSRGNGAVSEGSEVAKAGSTGLSTGPHCHWDINNQGTYPSSFGAFIDPAQWLNVSGPTPAPTLQPNQRVLSNPSGVNQREQPNTSSRVIKEWPFDQEPFTFKGYVTGETVSGNNVWFVGAISGGYFWSGSFKGGADTNGLQNLNPQPTPTPPSGLQPYQRKAGSEGVNERTSPSTSASIYKEWPAGDVFDFKGYVRGQPVNGNNIWFVGKYNGRYFWSGAFEDTSAHDLPDLTQSSPDSPPPQPSPESTPLFEKELVCVTGVVPAHPSNYEIGNFPTPPSGVVLHDFGTDGRDTLQSSLNHFRVKDTTAPLLAISGDEIIQCGKLTWRMYHAGPQGNDKWGLEIDPDVDTNPKTQASVKRALAELDLIAGKPLTRHKHPEFMKTSCGDEIDLNKFQPETSLDARIKKIEDYLTNKFGDF